METNQPQTEEPELTLELVSVGKNGSATVTARIGTDVLLVEKIDLARGKQRAAFAAKLADGRPGIDQAEIEAELMRQAARLTEAKTPESEPASPVAEIDASGIIRPERIIRPEVSGFSAPTMTAADDKVTGRWLAYLQWADGRRERRPLGTALEMPDGGRLYVHPEAGEPTPEHETGLDGWRPAEVAGWGTGPEPFRRVQRICKAIAYYLELPGKSASGTTATLALWVILTYAYHAWGAVPYLYLGGPLGSGKSLVFEILARLVFRPLGNQQPNRGFLVPEAFTHSGTLLLDEAERLKSTKDPDVGEILSMLLAGYKRGGQPFGWNPSGEHGFKTVVFNVYGPKALACIAGLPPALASRAITITMFRAGPGSDKPRRRIDAYPNRWAALRDDLHAMALEHGPRFLELADRPDVCPAMSGRDFELWQPLLALASWVESAGMEGLLALMQEHALAVIDAGRDEQVPDHDETLLKLLALAVARGDRPTPGELLDGAREAEPEAFKRWSARGVAEHLRRYGLQTSKSHGTKRYGLVTTEDLGRLQANYGFDLEITTE